MPDIPSLDEMADLDDADTREIEADLAIQTDNGPRPEDGDQPADHLQGNVGRDDLVDEEG